jgi:hypothetical protein
MFLLGITSTVNYLLYYKIVYYKEMALVATGTVLHGGAGGVLKKFTFKWDKKLFCQ